MDTATLTQDPLLDETQAAALMSVSPRTLQAWRLRGGGPPFVRVSSRIRYCPRALTAWLRSRSATASLPRKAKPVTLTCGSGLSPRMVDLIAVELARGFAGQVYIGAAASRRLSRALAPHEATLARALFRDGTIRADGTVRLVVPHNTAGASGFDPGVHRVAVSYDPRTGEWDSPCLRWAGRVRSPLHPRLAHPGPTRRHGRARPPGLHRRCLPHLAVRRSSSMSNHPVSAVEIFEKAPPLLGSSPLPERTEAIEAAWKRSTGAAETEDAARALPGSVSLGRAASIDDADLPPVARLRPHVEWPYGYAMMEGGLVYEVKDGGPMTLSGPFDVHAMVRAEDGTGWALAISFRDLDGRLHIVMVSRADLASGEASELRRELASKGLWLGSGRSHRERFAAGLAGLVVGTRALLVSKAGWHVNSTVYAAPSFTAAAGNRIGEPIIFRGDPGASLFREAGDLDTWRDQVAALAVGQTRLLFALSIAFAGPLLEPLGQEPGCFNLVGASSTGKTSALRLAGSVWGGGGPIGFASTWRTTSNALEGVCAQHNDSFLGLDELGMCPPHEVDAAAYSLTGGSGKSRLKSDGELRARQRWRVMVLSTAEITLGQRIAEGGFGKAVRAGQTVRFVDLPADAGRGFGLFDHVGAFGEAARLADAIRDRTGACYGLAGAAFVRAFLDAPDKALIAARAVIADFVARHVTEGSSGQVHRVALRFGFVAAAGELATGYGLLPIEPGAVTAAAGSLFLQWVDQRGGTGASEARSAVTQVRDFLHRHTLARFVPARAGLDAGSWRAQNVAGFRMDDEDGGDFCFMDGGFAEAVNGLDIRAAADALAEAGFLIKSSEGRRKAVVRIAGKPMRVFRVTASILEGEDGQ